MTGYLVLFFISHYNLCLRSEKFRVEDTKSLGVINRVIQQWAITHDHDFEHLLNTVLLSAL